jgi:uncharacterized protein
MPAGVVLPMLMSLLMVMAGCRAPAESNKVCYGRACFCVEIAFNMSAWSYGVMNRTYLPPGQGMLFMFPREESYPFWMKDTLIPLDIIWLDGNWTIVYIAHDQMPCSSVVCPAVSPNRSSLYVLEINGGLSEKLGMREGAKLRAELSGYPIKN